jgi:hypothetical protein
VETKILRSKFFTLVTPELQAKEAEKKRSTPIDQLPKVLYKPADHYLEYSKPTNDVNVGSAIHFPVNIDTEFLGKPLHWSEVFETIESESVPRKSRQTTRLHITTQMRAIEQNDGVIFASRECADQLPRHKPLETGFDPIDYLKHLGYRAELSRIDLSKCDKNVKRLFSGLPEFRVCMFAHFATAEVMLIVREEYWRDFDTLMATPDPIVPPGKPRFTMKRNLKAITEQVSFKNGNLIIQNFVEMPWILELNDRKFRVTVEWVDSSALHGVGSYEAICKSARVPIPHKDNFTKAEKARMLDMAIDRPEDFDNYALGDLYVFDALVGNAENFRKVYQALGVEHLFKYPALTIGATVKNLFEAKLCSELGVNYLVRDEVNYLRENFLSPTSAKKLRENPGLTRCLAAKVEGGRCRSNRPTDWKVDSALCDIDVSGCYAEGLRYQPYPIGNPLILDYPSDERNSYETLGQFRKVYGNELVRGLWVARVWTRERLEYAQDFLASWFLPSVGDDLLSMAKYVQVMVNDSESQNRDEAPEFELDDGQLKIFNHEVINGVITHDFLDWLDHVATPRQRKELETKLLVKVAVMYPKSWEIQGTDSVERYRTLVSDSQNHTDSNVVKATRKKGKLSKITIDGQYHGWFSVNIGELIIDDLLTWRKYYQKTEGKKKPMDLVFKLCCNTLYGDMTSKYFDAANVIVGNNVTARARAMVWYTEKALHTLQIVTDGGAFELNRVIYPTGKKFRISGENTVNLYTCDDRQANRTRNVRIAPLGGCDSIAIDWVKNPKYTEEIDRIVSEHSIDRYHVRINRKNEWYLDSAEGSFELSNVPYNAQLQLKKGDEVTVKSPKDSEQWINDTAMEHLQTQFQKVEVLHAQSQRLDADISGDVPKKIYSDRIGLFSFEMKAFFDQGSFHGSANYALVSPNQTNLKMRSYETAKPHESVRGAVSVDLETRDRVIDPYISDRYDDENNPAYDFMMALLKGDPVARQEAFVKDGILKPNDYKERRSKYQELGIVPGDNLLKTGLLREFSISQFTFCTMKQFVKWEKETSKLKNKFGQSVERYFLAPDGKLDFGAMVENCDRLIRAENETPIETLDPNFTKPTKVVLEHPEFGAYVSVKHLLGLSKDDE